MLSVAQAVHHPETPGSASKHTSLGHPWASDRSNMLKRRKTEPDTCIAEKKPSMKNSIENLTKHFHINNQEITLTVIPKNNSQADIKELIQGKIKTSPSTEMVEKEEVISEKSQEEKRESARIPINISPVVISFFENSGEIQLTKLGSNENIRLVSQNEIVDECLETKEDSSEYLNDCLQDVLRMGETRELSEVTIEPCASSHKSKSVSSPITCKSKKTNKSLSSRLEKARDLLIKNKENAENKFYTSEVCNVTETFDDNLKVSQIKADQTFDFDNKSGFVQEVPDQNFDTLNYIRPSSSLFEVEPDHNVPVSTVTDYEPFNVGLSCDHYYSNNRDRPHYTTGFPNPPGENRCWTNATLQALFALPIISKLGSLDMPECSKLTASLIEVQKFWKRRCTRSLSFDQIFTTFKDDLSVLDKFYTSKAQQDVSEFIMNLLNFIKTEFETMLSKESHSNEIENIPNNEQDSLRRSQNSIHDTNRRSPLADISAKQLGNNNPTVYGSQQDILNDKTKNDSQNEEIINPIDEYFSLYMVENYICDGCSKQRQQKVENLILFIDLPAEDNGTTVDLVDMINTTYALEHRNMTCESCKHEEHSMITKFKKIPKILTVQVKRYEMTNDLTINKKSTLVEIPKLLKLDSLVINDSQEFDHSTEYEPICIISHIGDNIDSGHYVSFVKHHDQWFFYDDMNVKILSVDEVFKCIQNNAYVIFFQDTKLNQNSNILIDEKNKKESIIC